MVKSYVELESYRGNSIRIPGEDASDEARAEFHAKLQSKVPGLVPRPDSPEAVRALQQAMGAPEDGSAYKPPEIDSKGVNLDTGPIDAFRGIAAKHGLTQEQFAGIVGDMSNANVATAVEQQRVTDADNVALQQEWGHAYDQKTAQIARFAEQTKAPAELVAALRAGKFNSGTARWLDSLMTQFSGGQTKQFDIDSPSDPIMTPKEAKVKINEVLGNKKHAYFNQADPGHKDAIDQMREWYKLTSPSGSTGIGTVGVGSQVDFE